MSLDINWSALTTGTSGDELAISIRDFVNHRFQQIELPRFIRSVEIHTFSFGSSCPEITLRDITDPLSDFYDESSDSGSSADDNNDAQSPIADPPPARPAKIPPISTQNVRPSGPLPLRTPTPGIPGGTSNLNYFHLPLSTLSGTTTPNPFGPTFAQYHHHNRPPSPPRTVVDAYADPSSPPSASHKPNVPSARLPTEVTSLSEENDKRNPLDLQTVLHISYSGDVSLSLTAEILLDYPSPGFVNIPLKLRITGLDFDGVGVVAYLSDRKNVRAAQELATDENGADNSSGTGKIKFSFLTPDDAAALLSFNHSTPSPTNTRPITSNIVEETPTKPQRFGNLLQEIRVESEIGRQQPGHPVLKNVGKVEKFVLEQVRRIFDEELVWPGWWTFLV